MSDHLSNSNFQASESLHPCNLWIQPRWSWFRPEVNLRAGAPKAFCVDLGSDLEDSGLASDTELMQLPQKVASLPRRPERMTMAIVFNWFWNLWCLAGFGAQLLLMVD